MMTQGSGVTTAHPPYRPAAKGSSPRLARLQPRGTAVAVVLTLSSEQKDERFDAEVQLLQPASSSWHVLWQFKLPERSVVHDLAWNGSGETLIVAHSTSADPTDPVTEAGSVAAATRITRYSMHTCSVTTFTIESASPSRFTQYLAYQLRPPSSPNTTTIEHQIGIDSFAVATRRFLQPSLSARNAHAPPTTATTPPLFSIHISEAGEVSICDPIGADFACLSSPDQGQCLFRESTRILDSFQSPARDLLYLLAAAPLDAHESPTHQSWWELSIQSIQLPRSFLVDDYTAMAVARSEVEAAFTNLSSACSALSEVYEQFTSDFAVLVDPFMEASDAKAEELLENWTQGALFLSGRQIAAAELISALSTGIPSDHVKKSLSDSLADDHSPEYRPNVAFNSWRQRQPHFDRLLVQCLHTFQTQLDFLSHVLLKWSSATILSTPILDTLVTLEDVDPELGILPSTPSCTFRDVFLALNSRARIVGASAKALSSKCAGLATWLYRIANPKGPHHLSNGTVSGFMDTVQAIKMCVEQEKYPAWELIVGRDMTPPVRPMPWSESPLSGMRHLSDSARALLESMKVGDVVALLKRRWDEAALVEMDKVVRRATSELSLMAHVSLLHFESSVDDLDFVSSAMVEVDSNLVVAMTSRSSLKPIQLVVLQPDTASAWSSARITRFSSTPSTSSPWPADSIARNLRFLARHDDDSSHTSSTLFVTTTSTTSESDPGVSYCRVPVDSLSWMAPMSFDNPLWDERQWADEDGSGGSQVHEAQLADALQDVDGAKPESAAAWLDGTDERSVVASGRGILLLNM